jgi:hypothetical protein
MRQRSGPLLSGSAVGDPTRKSIRESAHCPHVRGARGIASPSSGAPATTCGAARGLSPTLQQQVSSRIPRAGAVK